VTRPNYAAKKKARGHRRGGGQDQWANTHSTFVGGIGSRWYVMCPCGHHWTYQDEVSAVAGAALHSGEAS
jgi:hypothetical protein